jgi:hypothetical protein
MGDCGVGVGINTSGLVLVTEQWQFEPFLYKSLGIGIKSVLHKLTFAVSNQMVRFGVGAICLGEARDGYRHFK